MHLAYYNFILTKVRFTGRIFHTDLESLPSLIHKFKIINWPELTFKLSEGKRVVKLEARTVSLYLLGLYSCSSTRENRSNLSSDFKSWPYTDLHTSKLDQAFPRQGNLWFRQFVKQGRDLVWFCVSEWVSEWRDASVVLANPELSRSAAEKILVLLKRREKEVFGSTKQAKLLFFFLKQGNFVMIKPKNICMFWKYLFEKTWYSVQWAKRSGVTALKVWEASGEVNTNLLWSVVVYKQQEKISAYYFMANILQVICSVLGK